MHSANQLKILPNITIHRTSGKLRFHVMHKHVVALLVSAPLVVIASAGPNVTGYFEASPGVGGARNRMCIKRMADKRLDIYVASGYCPSEECLNFRPESLWFQASLKSNRVHYTNNFGCNLTVLFHERLARVIHTSQCRDDEHPYLYANGAYRFVKSEIREEDCGP